MMFFPACASSSKYLVYEKKGDLFEFIVTNDRIIFECQDADAEDRKRTTGFMMHVLDDENTVTTFIHPSLLGEKDCSRFVKTIQEIMSKGAKVYIAGSTGNFDAPRIKEKDPYTFPRKGTFYSNGRNGQLRFIANETKECFSPLYNKTDTDPCPDWPFPIKKMPF